MLKLVLVSQNSCFPCKALKMIIEQPENQEYIKNSELEFDYINLDDLEDRESFVEEYKVTATPFTMVKTKNQVLARKAGKQNFQEIMEMIEYVKKGDSIED